MRVLVTRPAAAGQQLVQWLRAAGIAAWHMPLAEFLPGRELAALPGLLEKLQGDDVLFAASPQAVAQSRACLQARRSHWRGAPVQAFAPGGATAQALQRASGLAVSYAHNRQASETLLQFPALQQVAGKQVLILRGNGGRELLADTLTARGARVTCCECYQRRMIAYQGDEQARRWQRQAVDTLVVTSGEMLRRLADLMPAQQHPWLLACRLVVVSERLAALAHGAGWQQVAIADAADNVALLRILQSLSYGKA